MRPAIQAICEEVANHFGWLTAEDIMGRLRSKSVDDARALAVWLTRRRLGLSYPELGREFGRDHSTCRSAFQRIEASSGQLRVLAEELSQATGDRARKAPSLKACQEHMCEFGCSGVGQHVLVGAA